MSSAQKARQDLVRTVAELANKAFSPDSSPEVRIEGKRALDDLVQR